MYMGPSSRLIHAARVSNGLILTWRHPPEDSLPAFPARFTLGEILERRIPPQLNRIFGYARGLEIQGVGV